MTITSNSAASSPLSNGGPGRLPVGSGSAPAKISGTFGVGQVLTAAAPAGATGATYQWTRDGTNISGATSAAYTQIQADIGKAIDCKVTYTTTASGGTTAGVAPDAMASLVLTAMAGAVSAAWTAGASNGGAAATANIVLSNGLTGSGASPVVISTPNGTPVSATGTLTNVYGTSAPTASNTVTPVANTAINVTTFPYTLQAADSGKTLNLQPAAEAKVIYPASLGASFNCTLKQPSDNAFPITIEEASGVVGKNTNGLFISASAGVQAKGLGSPMLRGPGATVTVAATAADQFTLGGDVGKWQHIAHHTNYPAVWATALRQMSAASIHKLPGGKTGTFFTCIKFLYTNVYGVGESVAPADITITSALEYPMAAGTTPIQATFNGATSVTLTGGVKTVVVTDPIYPATPIPVDAFIRARTWQGGASGLVTNFGRDRQDYWTYGTTVGVDLDRTMQLYSTFPALSYTLHGTAFASPQSLRPLAIIGVTDTGAIILIGTSRDVASNGDYPTPGGSGMQGEGERAWGRRGAILNLAAATESMNGAWVSGNVGGSAIRRALFQYGGPVVNNYGVNDLNGGTAANIAALFTTTYNTSAEFVGRPMYVNTITASLISTSDYFTTTAGQTPTNAANETKRMAINDMIRAGGLPRVTGYCEIADATETARNSGLLKVNARGRTITDGSISAGTNVFNSPAQAQFTSADDGCYISLPMGAAGAVVHAVMKYVSATSVNLISYVQLAAYNAVTAVAAGQSVYLCSLEVMQVDGNHETQRGGNLIEALAIPPTLPAIGPIN